MTVSVAGLDHVNIRTRDLDASAAFYVETLGLRMGDPPAPIGRDAARWLFDAGDRPIIHLRSYDAEPGDTGALDHVALRCTGRASVLDRLAAQGRDFQVMAIGDRGIVFVRDPHGIMLELNFVGE